jgi:hypothetical protein
MVIWHDDTEALVPVKTQEVHGDQGSDWASTAGELQPKTPAYILYRLDTKKMEAYEWVLIAFVPDGSSVRERMLYASSRDNLRKQLGYNYFGEDLYGSQPVSADSSHSLPLNVSSLLCSSSLFFLFLFLSLLLLLSSSSSLFLLLFLALPSSLADVLWCCWLLFRMR